MTGTPLTFQTAPIAQAVAPRRRAIARWRRAQGFGGLVLACTFFLPAVDGCSSVVVPYEEVREIVMSPLSPLQDYLAGFAVYTAAYLYGLMILIVALHRRDAESRSARVCGTIAGCIIGGTGIAVLIGPTLDQGVTALAAMSSGEIVWLLVCVIACGYWLRCLRRGPSGIMCMRWFGALCCVAWFTPWALGGAYYGLYLSLAGSLLILVGTFREAQLRTFQDRPATLRALLMASLNLPNADADLCDECGYTLRGLTTPRCPECGTPFDFKALSARDDSAF